MMSSDDDAVERELLALRAGALPRPRLDVADVFARAAAIKATPVLRLRLPRAAAWAGAAACAAAILLAVVRSGDPGNVLRHTAGHVDHPSSIVAGAPEVPTDSDAPACSVETMSSSTGDSPVQPAEPLASRPLASLPAIALLGAGFERAMCSDSRDLRQRRGLVCDQGVTFSSAGP